MTSEVLPIPSWYKSIFRATKCFPFSISLLSTYYVLAKALGLGDMGVNIQTQTLLPWTFLPSGVEREQ